eukprot:GSChrysophyteH1.ASY1.ANO1.1432.1 assembled CDS
MISIKFCIALVLTVVVFYKGVEHGGRDAASSKYYTSMCNSENKSASSTPTLAASSEQKQEPCDQDASQGVPKNQDLETNFVQQKAPECVGSVQNHHHIFTVIENGQADFLFDPTHGKRIGELGQRGTTIMLSPAGNISISNTHSNSRECTYIAQHYAHHCFGVVFVSNMHGGSYGTGSSSRSSSGTPQQSYRASTNRMTGVPVTRFDSSVDRDGLVVDGGNDNIVDRADKGSREDQESKGIGDSALNKGHDRPAGHFRRVPKERGFQRVEEKLGSFLRNFRGIEASLDEKLRWRGIKKGDDVVVMVVNEGETDLFLNFACSCKLHGISLRNVLVFAGNKEAVPIFEATEALAVYHPAFAAVSKKASKDYLDRVFVDMMWYKAFSVYLVLRRGINTLFQDVDLVWFKSPFEYFHTPNGTALHTSTTRGKTVEAYFSDDGQRSKRYSPYFFNSGFYYLKSTPRSEYFAWSIMTDFDAVQVTGSHQNVFTLRLVEGTQGFGLGAAFTQILPPFQFPNGILYHHNKKYMQRMEKHEEDPYHFHMCWTQGKPQKLEYLRKAKMWYLQEQCSALEDLIHPYGAMYKNIIKQDIGYNLKANDWTRPDMPETQSSRFIYSNCCKRSGLNQHEIKT